MSLAEEEETKRGTKTLLTLANPRSLLHNSFFFRYEPKAK